MLVALLGGSVVLAQSTPSHAAPITFNLYSNSPDIINAQGKTNPIFGLGTTAPIFSADYIGPSLEFKKEGVKLTISNPVGASGHSVSRSTTTLGTCLGGNRPSSMVVCGNDGSSWAPQISSIKLKFDKTVKLISTSGVLRSFFAEVGTAVPVVDSTWTSQVLSESFTYQNTIPAPNSNLSFTNSYASTFNNNFIVTANTEIIVSSVFSETPPNSPGNLDYWVQTLEVDAVPAPGPLPLFGAITAFGWSRRMRKRIKQPKTF
jgi:hypothetical protein